MNSLQSFNNPSKGVLTLQQTIDEILEFMEPGPKQKHKLIIGTDSQQNNGHATVDFVTAIIIHKVGKGGRYFWHRINENKLYTLRNRIYKEVTLSFTLAQEFMGQFKANIKDKDLDYELEIHIDIGENGDTRELIKEVVGMIRGFGFNTKIKPESFGASKVADRHT